MAVGWTRKMDKVHQQFKVNTIILYFKDVIVYFIAVLLQL